MDIVQEPAEITIQPSEPPAAPSPETPADDSSLSEHIEAFHSEDTPPTAEDKPEPKAKHRSFKNQMRAEDVPRLKAETAKLKAAETERDEWRRKYEEATRTQAEPKPYTPPAQTATTEFAEPEPKLEDPKYAGTADPYSAWQRDLARYDRRKEAFDAEQAKRTETETAQNQQAQQFWQGKEREYQTNINAYLAEHPERVETFKKIPNANIPLLYHTILTLPDGPDVVYRLLEHPTALDEVLLLTDGKPVSELHVAATTKWLRSRLQAGPTGAAVSVSTPPVSAPRPPTPVRTAPMPPADSPPSDTSSLFEHQRFFKTAR